MKPSISLTDADVAVLDVHVRAAGPASRSAAVQHAIRMLARERLQQDDAETWDEWTCPVTGRRGRP